ncbi:MAG: molybdopterin-synthase adenylyltransferase MoeB [Gemmatimonadales bacterium]|nr:molybdopterin-synthase adenylyltransferase MoeB [Gemmatimonadales bacterium]
MTPPDTPAPELAPAELVRYARHLTLPEVGLAGQSRLKAARVLLVGAGGLGSPAALYLAAAGVGTLGIVDHDRLDLTNLQRQVLHGTAAVGSPKVVSAAARLRDLNPHVQVETFDLRLGRGNARDVVRAFDLVIDGSDNFPTRYLVSDACVLERKPLVYGSIFRFDGQVSLFHPPQGPCYRCLFAEPPAPGSVPSCAEGGVLGVLPGIVGSLQALEAIKWIVGAGEPLLGRLLLVDALRLRFREIALRRDPACPACGERPTVTDLIDYDAFCGLAPVLADDLELDVFELRERLRADPPPFLLDVREPWEHRLVRMEPAALVPLGELPARVGELPPRGPIVVVCHHGVRSRAAAELLRAAGFADARSLAGGIDAWAREVDTGMARY